jgi:hypothetical protein
VVLAETVVASRSAEEVLSKRHINASSGSFSHHQLSGIVHTQNQVVIVSCAQDLYCHRSGGGVCNHGGLCSSYRVGVVAERILHVGIAEIHGKKGEGEQKLGPART